MPTKTTPVWTVNTIKPRVLYEVMQPNGLWLVTTARSEDDAVEIAKACNATRELKP